MIVVKDLAKSYMQGTTTIPALKNVQLAIEKGETVSVMGHSGSGKSTFLSLLSGVEQPTSGRIMFGDTDVAALDEGSLADFRSRHIGIVFQQFHLMQSLTAEENVALPLELRGEKEAFKKARAALTSVGLGHRLEHLPNQLSGGECQRVAIARAFIVEPDLLLADEPSGNLDDETGSKVMDLFFDLVREHHSTLILVTHNAELAQRCQSQYRLAKGELSRVV